MTEALIRVSARDERDVITAALIRHGALAEPAVLQAQWLVEADLRGQSSHGIARLPILVGRIRAGLLAPNSEPLMNWRTDSVLAVDGARGFGPVVATKALTLSHERARDTGIVLVVISNANHLGILAPYVEGAAAQGLVALACTTSEALVHPWGGCRAMVGTNPLAVAVPAQPAPFVLDMATGQVSMGKIIHCDESGLALEPGWAVDSEGRPTTDAHAAREGAITPFGGAKGFALGLAIEVLVGSLTDSALGRKVQGTLDDTSVCNKGDVFIVIDPGPVTEGSRSALISRYLDDVRCTPVPPGGEDVRIPGDRAAHHKARRTSEGIELSSRSWSTALTLAGAPPGSTSVSARDVRPDPEA